MTKQWNNITHTRVEACSAVTVGLYLTSVTTGSVFRFPEWLLFQNVLYLLSEKKDIKHRSFDVEVM